MPSSHTLESKPYRSRIAQRLAAVIGLLSQANDLDALLALVLEAACELTNSETSSILLYEAETGLLKFAAVPAASSDANKNKAFRRLRVPLEGSVAGKCYTTSQPIVVQEDFDARVYRKVDQTVSFVTRSLAAAPLIFGGQTIGVLEALNRRPDDEKPSSSLYTTDDVEILVTLAAAAASAIEQDRLSRQVKHVYTALEELEKRKSNFIAVASHELRTPLGLILGHSTFLQERLKGREPETLKSLQVMVESALRLKKIIEELENAEKLEKRRLGVERQHFRLDLLALQVMASFQNAASSKGIELIADLPDDAVLVEGDEEKLSIVVHNLISNAVAFTGQGGHVLVTGERLPGYVKMSVTDDGVGIAARDLPHVFDRFYQVEDHLTRRHAGMGLGLSVAKAMVELHGGQIWAESSEGRGSSFSFLLPLGEPPAPNSLTFE